jgi:hypothetical protein
MKVFKSFFFWTSVVAVILLIAYRKQLKKWLDANTPEGTMQQVETAADKLGNITSETANTALAAIHKVSNDLLAAKANNQIYETTDYVDTDPIIQTMIKPAGFIPSQTLAERVFVRTAEETDAANPLRLTRENAWYPKIFYRNGIKVKKEKLFSPMGMHSNDCDCEGCGTVIIQQ